jgi:hypothetical protein
MLLTTSILLLTTCKTSENKKDFRSFKNCSGPTSSSANNNNNSVAPDYQPRNPQNTKSVGGTNGYGQQTAYQLQQNGNVVNNNTWPGVLTLIQQRCISCHGAVRPPRAPALDTYQASRLMAEKIIEVTVINSTMPPSGSLSTLEKNTLIAWQTNNFEGPPENIIKNSNNMPISDDDVGYKDDCL